MGENECICGPQYYKSNDVTNCTNCNLKEGIVCKQIGVGNMPPIVKNFWRYGLPNRNDIEIIYKCPYEDTCIGGYNNENRCYKVINKDTKPNIQVEFKGEKKVFSPEEISAMVLTKMKETAEQ